MRRTRSRRSVRCGLCLGTSTSVPPPCSSVPPSPLPLPRRECAGRSSTMTGLPSMQMNCPPYFQLFPLQTACVDDIPISANFIFHVTIHTSTLLLLRFCLSGNKGVSRGIIPVSKNKANFNHCALCFPLSRYRLNRLSLLCS